jgi:uncharacterized membrane protein YfcA
VSRSLVLVWILQAARPMFDLILLFAVGLLAGALGGLLGIGGGVLLMPVLRFGIGLPASLAAGTCVLVVLCTTLAGSYRHYRLGHVSPGPLVPVILAGAVSTTLCCLLFGWLAARARWLDLGVGLVIGLIAGRMLLEGLRGLRPPPSAASDRLPGSLGAKVAIGGAAGTLPGLLGIGTGGILVPAFALGLRAPIRTAMAASLLCFAVNAGISALFKLAQGYVVLALALPLGFGALLGANLGAWFNRRFPSRTLKVVFGLLFAFVSAKFIVAGR